MGEHVAATCRPIATVRTRRHEPRAARRTRIARHNPTPVPLAASPDASWALNPGALVLVAAIGYVYVRRWRAARAQAGPRAASGWRLVSFLAGLACVLVALVSPVDRLAEQVFTMHMVQHLLLLDIAPILCLLGLTKVILRPATRRLLPLERSWARPPRLRRRPLRGDHVGLAHPRALRRGAGAGRGPRARAPQLRHRRRPVLVAPALADPHPAARGRHGARRLHGLDEGARRHPRHRPDLLARRRSTRSTRTSPATGG